jgi:hypothetical protein
METIHHDIEFASKFKPMSPEKLFKKNKADGSPKADFVE